MSIIFDDTSSEGGEMEREIGNNEQFESNDSVIPEERSVVSSYNDSIEPNFSTLLSMFPNVDQKYIRQICIKPPFDEAEGDCLLMLINHLLSYDDKIDESLISELNEERDQVNHMDENLILQIMGVEEQQYNETQNDHPLSEILEIQDIENVEQQKQNAAMLNEQLFSEFLQQDQDVVDEKMKILENILPDANPNDLREFLQKNHDNINSLEQFVESKLLDKNYQKRDQYYTRIKTKEKVEQYTTGFDIKKFIKQFPEPFEHFENPEREGAKQEKALNFLISRYNYAAQYVENIYSLSKYNLSLADKHLQRLSGSNPSVKFNIESDNIPLLQEIAFIENKSSIEDYLEVIKQKEEKEMRLLRAQKLLLECQCCYNEVKPYDCIECENNHIFCRKCIIKGTDLAIANGQVSVNCFMGCNSEITLNILQRVLSPNTFDVFLKKRQEFEVNAAKLDDLVNCPFCSYSMELAPQIQIFICKNPECMKITCRLCKRMNHLPIKCKDVLDEHKGRLFIEEEMSKELIRYCHKCQKPFVKLDGCNKMTCPCGAMMCYICKQPIIGYHHFDHARCKTHQNSDLFDQEQVELRRVQAVTKLQSDFPDLEIPDV